MRIALVVSDLTYPATEGLHQQSLTLLTSLRKLGHQVDLFGFVRKSSSLDLLKMKNLGIEFRAPAVSYSGSSLLRAVRILAVGMDARSSVLVAKLLAGHYDIVHLDGSLSCTLSPFLGRQARVLSWVDPGSRRFKRLAHEETQFGRKASKHVARMLYHMIENRLAFTGPPWHVVSEEDATYLRQLYAGQRVWSVPVMLPPELPGTKRIDQRPVDRHFTVTVFCDLRQDFTRTAFRRFITRVARKSKYREFIHFQVLGRVPATKDLTTFAEGLSLDYIGWADDYVEVLTSSDLVILPDLTGTGLKNRAIQSLALAVPVIGTDVAFEGIPVVNGESAVVVHSWKEFLIRFDESYEDRDLGARIAATGKNVVYARFGSANIAREWLTHYEELLTAT